LVADIERLIRVDEDEVPMLVEVRELRLVEVLEVLGVTSAVIIMEAADGSEVVEETLMVLEVVPGVEFSSTQPGP